jgi:hypothetical protein
MTPEYCYNCKNYIGAEFVDDLYTDVCKAFPKGIPKEIILLEETHETVKKDQVGDFVFDEKE